MTTRQFSRAAMLLLLMVLTTVSAWATDDSGSCGTNVTYTYVESTHTLTISGTGAMANYDLEGAPWYSYCSNITTVIIGSGVTSIGSNAFVLCNGLTSVTIPNSVTSIGDNAFMNCFSLTSIEIPASVTSIGNTAFASCFSLASISVASGNTKYHSDGNCIIETASNTLILGCKTSVIPTGVTSIGDDAFAGCTGLTSITIPANVTSIGGGAFKGCTGLTSIEIPVTVTSIGDNAFLSCQGLTSITIPNSVTSIGIRAFGYCTSLTSIEIPASVTSIGEYAFSGCSNLTSVTIYAPSLTTYGSNAFSNNASGRKIYVFSDCVDTYKAGWSGYASDIEAITNPHGTCGTVGHEADLRWVLTGTSPNYTLNIFGSGAMKDYPRDTEELPWNSYGGMSTVVIGNGVTHIGNNAFHGCGSLASITIPNSVTSIGGDAFMSCSSLASITIPNSVTSIGDSAFERCDGLTSVTFGNSVTSIGGDAFMNCSSLASIEIPASVTSIGDRAFESCFSLASISVASGNTKYHSEGNCLIETATNKLIRGCKTSVIPTGVTSIGECAFNGCSALTNIEIPDDVTSIGDDAFSGCTGLTSITFGNSVTSIGDYAFNGCNALTSIEIPASVTSIGDGAFYSCSSLASITIYAPSLTTYGEDAFKNNASGRKIYVPMASLDTYQTNWSEYAGDIVGFSSCGDNVYYLYNSTTHTLNIFGSGAMADYTEGAAPWYSYCSNITTVIIGNGVTSIGSNAFNSCNALTSITFGNGVTSIGDRAFYSCSSLTSIEIPASVTHIGNNAFFQCTGLSSITIPDNVTSIGNDAFYDCTSLTSIEIPASVTSIGYTAFAYCSSLASISVASGNTKYHSEGNCLIETATKTLIQGCKTSVIPTGVTSIGERAFSCYTGLTSIEIPASVTSIGDWAFERCDGLTSVTFGNSVTSIGERAFYCCTGLTSIEIPASVTSIGNWAFSDCSSLISVTIYAPSLTYYGYAAFDYNASGRKIYVFSDCVTAYKAGWSGYASDIEAITNPHGTCGTVGHEADLRWVLTGTSPNYTLNIFGTGAMEDYDDGGAPWYSHCADITKVVISNGVTSIGDNAFFKCNNTGFTTIAIPASVTNIGDDAFLGCTSLTDVYYYANPTPALLSNWDLDGDDFKAGKATKCHVFDIDDWEDFKNTNVTFVGDLAGKNEFSPVLWGYDNGTQTLTISGTGAMADYNSDNQPWKDFRGDITSVVIEDGVTSIGDYAFFDCPSLASVTIYAPELTYYGEDAFSNNASGRKIYVFSDCVDTYKTGWSGYADDILPIEGIALTANAHDGNYWTTFYCGLEGFEIKDGENACAYTATVSGDQLTLHKLGKVIPKGTAVIIVGADNSISMTASTDAAENTVSNDLHGVNVRTEKSTLGTGTFYVMGKVNGNFGFFQYTAEYMPARKAYLLIADSSAPSLTMVFDDETTEIKTTDFTDYTDKADTWYSLDGRKLDKQPTAKGIYIHNGRKEVVR